MKRILLFALAISASMSAAYAQPVMSAAKNNPVVGDMFYGHIVDTTGVTRGAAGASITWNYSFIYDVNYDTATYLACSATPRCDSFPTSNIVLFSGGGYSYGTTSSSSLKGIGEYAPGSPCIFINGNYDVFAYPFTYGNTHKDTFTAIVNTGFTLLYVTTTDSFIADGYGTLILPHSTTPNVLRIHRITISKDSANVFGTPFVTVAQNEAYDWFDTTGFHNELLQIDIDTAGGTTPYVSNAEYYTITPPIPLYTANVAGASSALEVFPNPASNEVNLRFSIKDSKSALITMTDLTGREVATVTSDKMTTGTNNISIPVSGIAPGMYLIRLTGVGENLTQKVVISR